MSITPYNFFSSSGSVSMLVFLAFPVVIVIAACKKNEVEIKKEVSRRDVLETSKKLALIWFLAQLLD